MQHFIGAIATTATATAAAAASASESPTAAAAASDPTHERGDSSPSPKRQRIGEHNTASQGHRATSVDAAAARMLLSSTSVSADKQMQRRSSHSGGSDTMGAPVQHLTYAAATLATDEHVDQKIDNVMVDSDPSQSVSAAAEAAAAAGSTSTAVTAALSATATTAADPADSARQPEPPSDQWVREMLGRIQSELNSDKPMTQLTAVQRANITVLLWILQRRPELKTQMELVSTLTSYSQRCGLLRAYADEFILMCAYVCLLQIYCRLQVKRMFALVGELEPQKVKGPHAVMLERARQAFVPGTDARRSEASTQDELMSLERNVAAVRRFLQADKPTASQFNKIVNTELANLTASMCLMFFAVIEPSPLAEIKSDSDLGKAIDQACLIFSAMEDPKGHTGWLQLTYPEGWADWVSRMASLAFHLLLVQTHYGSAAPAPDVCAGLKGMEHACRFLLQYLLLSRQPERFIEGLTVLEMCGHRTDTHLLQWVDCIRREHSARSRAGIIALWPRSLASVTVGPTPPSSKKSSSSANLADLLHMGAVMLMYGAARSEHPRPSASAASAHEAPAASARRTHTSAAPSQPLRSDASVASTSAARGVHATGGATGYGARADAAAAATGSTSPAAASSRGPGAAVGGGARAAGQPSLGHISILLIVKRVDPFSVECAYDSELSTTRSIAELLTDNPALLDWCSRDNKDTESFLRSTKIPDREASLQPHRAEQSLRNLHNIPIREFKLMTLHYMLGLHGWVADQHADQRACRFRDGFDITVPHGPRPRQLRVLLLPQDALNSALEQVLSEQYFAWPTPGAGTTTPFEKLMVRPMDLEAASSSWKDVGREAFVRQMWPFSDHTSVEQAPLIYRVCSSLQDALAGCRQGGAPIRLLYLPSLMWFAELGSQEKLRGALTIVRQQLAMWGGSPVGPLVHLFPPIMWEEKLEQKQEVYPLFADCMLQSHWKRLEAPGGAAELDSLCDALLQPWPPISGEYVVKAAWADGKTCVKSVPLKAEDFSYEATVRSARWIDLRRHIEAMHVERGQEWFTLQARSEELRAHEYRIWCLLVPEDFSNRESAKNWLVAVTLHSGYLPADRVAAYNAGPLDQRSSACLVFVNKLLVGEFFEQLKATGMPAVRVDCFYDSTAKKVYLNELTIPYDAMFLTQDHHVGVNRFLALRAVEATIERLQRTNLPVPDSALF